MRALSTIYLPHYENVKWEIILYTTANSIQVLNVNDITTKIKVEQLVGDNVAAKSILSSIFMTYIVAIILPLNLTPFYTLITIRIS